MPEYASKSCFPYVLYDFWKTFTDQHDYMKEKLFHNQSDGSEIGIKIAIPVETFTDQHDYMKEKLFHNQSDGSEIGIKIAIPVEI